MLLSAKARLRSGICNKISLVVITFKTFTKYIALFTFLYTCHRNKNLHFTSDTTCLNSIIINVLQQAIGAKKNTEVSSQLTCMPSSWLALICKAGLVPLQGFVICFLIVGSCLYPFKFIADLCIEPKPQQSHGTVPLYITISKEMITSP